MNRTKKIAAIAILLFTVISMTLAGCSPSGNRTADNKGNGTIKIATKPMTEQFILSEMLSILIEENTSLNVEITKGIGGGTANIHPALLNGEFDLYPEYTGTAWNYVLKKDNIPDDTTLMEQLVNEYSKEFELEWVGLYGFNNTFGLIIQNDLAEQYNIETFSDLALYSSEFVFGAEYDFYEREDGYDALCEEYGFNFLRQMDLDIGLKYQAINNKQVDVMNVGTTDGQISTSDITLLVDDLNFYQTYYCGTVVRQDTLDTCPELREVLMLMNGIITESEMAALNYEVEVNNREDRDMALEFLQSKGFVK